MAFRRVLFGLLVSTTLITWLALAINCGPRSSESSVYDYSLLGMFICCAIFVRSEAHLSRVGILFILCAFFVYFLAVLHDY
jgi:hypothetical protein